MTPAELGRILSEMYRGARDGLPCIPSPRRKASLTTAFMFLPVRRISR